MRRTRVLAVLMAATCAVCLMACSGDEGSPAASTGATSNPAGTTGTGIDSPLSYRAFEPPASPQCVALGRRFALTLNAEPSAGFRWQIQQPRPDPAVVLPVGTEFASAEGAPPGASDVQRESFAAQGGGTTDITMAYVQPDGTPVPDVAPETWTITVTLDGNCPPPPPDTTLPRQS